MLEVAAGRDAAVAGRVAVVAGRVGVAARALPVIIPTRIIRRIKTSACILLRRHTGNLAKRRPPFQVAVGDLILLMQRLQLRMIFLIDFLLPRL